VNGADLYSKFQRWENGQAGEQVRHILYDTLPYLSRGSSTGTAGPGPVMLIFQNYVIPPTDADKKMGKPPV
jgi:hypothetical protein